MKRVLQIEWKGRAMELRLEADGDRARLTVAEEGREPRTLDAEVSVKEPWTIVKTSAGTFRYATAAAPKGIWVTGEGRSGFFEFLRSGSSETKPAAEEVRAPMTGKVVRVEAKPGAEVKEGDLLIILEAMKMEYRLEAPAAGRIEAVDCEAGRTVELGQLLVKLKL